MDAKFWHKRWATNDIAWHERSGNTLLVEHFKALSLKLSGRVFVPLCGKTRDIAWLLGQGYKVVAIELSEMAIEALFQQLGMKAEVSQAGSLTRYSASNLEVFVGDFFSLSSEVIGSVDAVFDRAALVALPMEMRLKYTQHLAKITVNSEQLLIVFEYQQNLMDGPPFSISIDEINLHYKKYYSASQLSSVDVSGRLRGDFAAQENAYLLRPITASALSYSAK
ncbi:MAG: thiopurine S-methyltransferase [Arenicella sp.]|nr:thiopurine S-methyltransferase [Arenicella sp.]